MVQNRLRSCGQLGKGGDGGHNLGRAGSTTPRLKTHQQAESDRRDGAGWRRRGQAFPENQMQPPVTSFSRARARLRLITTVHMLACRGDAINDSIDRYCPNSGTRKGTAQLAPIWPQISCTRSLCEPCKRRRPVWAGERRTCHSSKCAAHSRRPVAAQGGLHSSQSAGRRSLCESLPHSPNRAYRATVHFWRRRTLDLLLFLPPIYFLVSCPSSPRTKPLRSLTSCVPCVGPFPWSLGMLVWSSSVATKQSYLSRAPCPKCGRRQDSCT